MTLQVLLVDINPKMIEAWKSSFEENTEVQIVHGSMLDQGVDAWVSPTNSQGRMNGGLDLVIKKHFGNRIEQAVQGEIHRVHGGTLPVGHAVCVRTGATLPKFLISTPTMHRTREDVSDTLNVALACAAALQRAHMQNAVEADSIRTLALPGLGANFGKVPVEICADLMWTAYELLRDQGFADFRQMRKALEEQLGDLDASSKPKKPASPGLSSPSGGGVRLTPPAPNAPPPKAADVDFDDAG
jgi:O-acetyl-ADP-ribose deacetylase (regulator of RNase III)